MYVCVVCTYIYGTFFCIIDIHVYIWSYTYTVRFLSDTCSHMYAWHVVDTLNQLIL